MKLVDNVKECYRWFSMQAFALSAAIATVWATLPADVKEMVPDSWERWIFVGIAGISVFGALGRIVKQSE